MHSSTASAQQMQGLCSRGQESDSKAGALHTGGPPGDLIAGNRAARNLCRWGQASSKSSFQASWFRVQSSGVRSQAAKRAHFMLVADQMTRSARETGLPETCAGEGRPAPDPAFRIHDSGFRIQDSGVRVQTVKRAHFMLVADQMTRS